MIYNLLCHSDLFYLIPFFNRDRINRIEDTILPLSVQSLYTDGLFHPANDSSPSSMTSAWIALDDVGLVLESSSMHLPSYFPSALRSEISASVNFTMDTVC
ncbi:hypothetical protein GLOIN_2v1785823 [Rhizophagus irregularis DAOM 181602=DAOM 197198]|nr:hypothetical protein GLOIN_2v1785823 [Rhizophagus irregularis DAOM 181602=DAOM 197198]